jgi:two-component system chemotaxis response regulator CheB
MPHIRVLVVEDSVTVRKHIVEVLSADPDLVVIGEAEDGKSAIELIRALRPDVVTLDMMLPVMSGVAVTEYVMAFCPTPILIVSSSTNRGELFKTYDALAAGAVDVLEKPREDVPDEVWARALRSAVKLVSRIKVITHIRGRRALSPLVDRAVRAGASPAPKLIAIGASTGGPAAVVQIFRELPSTFPVPILLTVHIGEPFGAAFADWLDSLSNLRVRCAVDREAVPSVGQPGILMAPPGRHLVAHKGLLRLTRDPERHSCRPSVDVLFESLAVELGAPSVGLLLTGMGRDGAAGLLAMRRAGALTIAQDEATSVVFGMPREAIAIGGAERILPLQDMAAAIIAAVSR